MQNINNANGGDLGAELFLSFGFIFLIFLYFLPTAIAFFRKRHNKGAICALNTFLGWTFLFWVLSLVWAVSSTEARQK